MTKPEDAASVHSGHRQRLKDQFLTHGMDPIHDVNVLELILFYAIPRQDTNPIAHRLLNTFGSLAAVFDATPEELMERVLQGPVFRCNNMIFLQNYDRMYHAGRTFGSIVGEGGKIVPCRTLFGSFGNPVELPEEVLYADNAYTV